MAWGDETAMKGLKLAFYAGRKGNTGGLHLVRITTTTADLTNTTSLCKLSGRFNAYDSSQWSKAPPICETCSVQSGVKAAPASPNNTPTERHLRVVK